jgi:hypothetical protein
MVATVRLPRLEYSSFRNPCLKGEIIRDTEIEGVTELRKNNKKPTHQV